jgi:hypothetical protein
MNYRVKNQMVVSCLINEQMKPVSLDKGFILKFVKEKEGISFYDLINACSDIMGGVVCLNEEQREQLEEVKAEAEEEKKDDRKYTLDPDKKYSGDEGIDYIVLYLQSNDLSKMITRDDSKTLFVDLGTLDMFPDAEKVDWIMKLNARIPIRTAVSISGRVKDGKKHLGIVLHDGFV